MPSLLDVRSSGLVMLMVPFLLSQPSSQALPYEAMSARIASALQVARGERVILRFDPNTMAALEPEVRKALEARGAVVETLAYGPADLSDRLKRTDVYIWLPAGAGAETPDDQRELLARWLDAGSGRQIHFHWLDGTRDVDGLAGLHSGAYDEMYLAALDLDYAGLSAQMDRVIAQLRSGEVHVTTPSGTDLRFRVGERPFNKQDGDASRARMAGARVRVDREVELPAGVIRVAPIEESVSGLIAFTSARFGDVRVTGIRLNVAGGLIVNATASSGSEALQQFLKSAPGASHFREFGLGFNPKLVMLPGHRSVPYYGYGDGVVRLSLGDNAEIGGAVRGGGVRWMFFTDTTVTAGSTPIVSDGKLVRGRSSSGG